MSRVIKFRAWIRDDCEFEGPGEFKMISGDTLAFEEYRPLVDHLEDVEGYKYLMQFTGLHDKNGKEIYEGDVFKKPVKINQSLHGHWAIYEFLIKNGLTIVSYIRSEKDTGIPRGYLASPYLDEFDVDTKTIMFATQVTLNDCEIIGNIYQNPELTKA